MNLRQYLESLGLKKDATEAEMWAFYARLTGEQRAAADALATRSDVPAGSPAGPPAAQQPPPIPASQRRDPDPEPPPAPNPPAPPDTEAIRAAAATSERQRITRVQELGRSLIGRGVSEELVTRAISEGMTIEQASTAFLEAVRNDRAPAVPSNVAVHLQRDTTIDVLSAGMIHRCGLPAEEAYRAMVPNAAEQTRRAQMEIIERGDRFRDMSMLDMCREAIRIDGGQIPAGRDELIRSAVSGAALTQIFTTSVNARLLLSYLQSEDSTRGMCRDVDVADFKTNERIGLGKTGNLEKLPRGDTAKHASIGDVKETYKISRYAKQFVIDEQDIIDDNLGALMDMPMEMGQAAARLRPDMFYAILLANAALSDAVALFHNDHGNLLDQALDATQLKAAIKKFRMAKYDGVNINISPAYIVSAVTLEFTVAELLKSAGIVITGTTDAVRGNANVLNGYIPNARSDSRLDNGVTNPDTGTAYSATTTAWFLLADPNSARTIECGYLAGSGRRPRLRSFVLDQGQYGLGWDIKHDIGMKVLDYRGIVRGNA